MLNSVRYMTLVSGNLKILCDGYDSPFSPAKKKDNPDEVELPFGLSFFVYCFAILCCAGPYSTLYLVLVLVEMCIECQWPLLDGVSCPPDEDGENGKYRVKR